MFARTLLVAGGSVLALAGAAVAQTVDTGSVVVDQNGPYVAAATTASPYEVNGRVVNIDPVDNVLVLDGRRAIALTPDMQIFQDGRQVALDSVRPAGYVTIRSVSPIPFSDRNKNRAAAPSASVAEPAAAPTTIVVVPAPGPVAYAGTVARIDPNGVVLTDGRLITTSAETVCLVDDRPVALSTLAPGTYAVIYPNGQQALVTPGQAMATAPSTTEISEAPAAAVPDEPIKVQGGLREYESTRQAP